MDSNSTKQFQAFINDPDKSIPESIINLDRKLRGLLLNVDQKLHTCYLYTGNDREEYINKLSLLAKELDKAISGIEHVVNTVSPLDAQTRKAFFQSEEMQEFNALALQQMEKMEHMNLELLA